MKYLQKHPITINESFSKKDTEILEFFSEYYDEDPNNFKIENVFVYKNQFVKEVTPYVKNTKDYRKGKMVTVRVDGSPNGPSYRMSKFSTSLETLKNILSDLERFYDITGEKVNYKIITDFTGVSIEFLVMGEPLSEDINRTNIIDRLLKELKDIFVSKGFRPKVKGNWFEVRTKGKKGMSIYGDYSIDLVTQFNKIKNGDELGPRYVDFIEWYNKVTDENLNIYLTNGDHQFVLKIVN